MRRSGVLLAWICLALLSRPAGAEPSCSLAGFAGSEAGRSATREAQLNPEGEFTRAMSSAAAYGEVNGDCAGEAAKLHFNLFGEHLRALFLQVPGHVFEHVLEHRLERLVHAMPQNT